MQLKKLLLSTAILILGGNLIAQETNNKQSYLDTTKAKIGQVEVDILSSYYDQDGIHSPVTGGRGTEDLQDLTNTLIISIPYGKNTFSINLGQDNITSASTDNMDTDVSSDSKVDSRNHGDITITHKLNKRKSYHVGAGFSSEYDVTSFNVGGGFSIESKDRNTSLDFNTKVYYDNWLLYQPAEFRPGVDSFVLENFNHQIYDSPNGEDTRTSYNFSLTIARVVNKKLQVSITGDFVYQTGLLNTPFHRVYFDDGFDASGLDELSTIKSKKVRKREFLPDSRIKIPVALRLHYYINSTFIVRGFYRYYYDDFGVIGNTIEIEVPTRISKAVAFFPFYRYHTQTAADYFAPFGEHKLTDKYYTSDYDLSDFDSHNYGMGFRYAPLFGVFQNAMSKKRMVKLKSINLRYAYYDRSDGLNSYLFSAGFSFTVF